MAETPTTTGGGGEQDAGYLAILRLQRSYADSVTRRAWHELAGQFRPDATLTVGAGERAIVVRGPGPIGELIDQSTEHLALLVFTVLNTVVAIDGDTARTRSFISEVHISRDTGQRHDLFGVYHDRLERLEDRWWFAERHWTRLARTGRGMDTAALPDAFTEWMHPPPT